MKFGIKLVVAVYNNKDLLYRNTMVIPEYYLTEKQAMDQIDIEKKSRLDKSFFFRSPDRKFDLVKYTEQGTMNTYLKFDVIKMKTHEFVKI